MSFNLGSICEIIMGQSPSGNSCNKDRNETPLLNGPTEFGSVHPSPVQFTSEPKKKSQKGDLLFCVRGSTTGRMNWSDQEYAIGRGLATIRGVDRYPNIYIKAVIETKLPELLLKATGSTFPNVSKEMISNISISKITAKDATTIATVLEPIDNRIALLQETNLTLEVIAQALFKSWFIDFDPVHAKQEGKQPKGMDKATATLFPDSFEQNELSKIPSKWKIKKLSDFLNLSYGKSLIAKKRVYGNFPVYGSGGLSGYHNEPLVNGPSIIVGRAGTIGSLYWEDRDFFPIDSTFYVETSISKFYCFYLLQTLDLPSMNTGAAVPGLNRNDVYRLKVILPEDKVLQKFDELVFIIRKNIFNNLNQIKNLTNFRNTFLPRLLNGKIKQIEIERNINNKKKITT